MAVHRRHRLAQAPEDGKTGDDWRVEPVWRCVPPSAAAAARCAVLSRRSRPRISSGASCCANSNPRSRCSAFEVHYQPIVAADGGGIVGVEALLRWNHPNARRHPAVGFHSPRRAERADGRNSAKSCCAARSPTAARWPDMFVAVNLSPLQIRDPRLVDLVGAVIAETGMPPRAWCWK